MSALRFGALAALLAALCLCLSGCGFTVIESAAPVEVGPAVTVPAEDPSSSLRQN